MRVVSKFNIGLIPACAGKTRSRPRIPFFARAHPRVCGENKQLRAVNV